MFVTSGAITQCFADGLIKMVMTKWLREANAPLTGLIQILDILQKIADGQIHINNE